MSSRLARNGLILWVLALGLLVPATASAYTVTVRVHGAGGVKETTDTKLTYCFGGISPSGKTNDTITDCVGGTADGLYGWGYVVSLIPDISSEAYRRGWRFFKWIDHTGASEINCDPQDTTGNFFQSECKFQIFNNLGIDLYFTDVQAPLDTYVSNRLPAAGSTESSQTATFTYAAPSDPDSTFVCQLEKPGQAAPGFTRCPQNGTTYTGLTADGRYTFSVRALDPQGNTNGNVATRSWTRDGTPPVPFISGNPAADAIVNLSSALFSLGPGSGGTIVSCVIDGTSVGISPACGPGATSASMSGLSEGSHTFTVYSQDASGNTGTASRSWIVDLTPPVAALTGGPAEGTRTPAKTATFTPTATDLNLDATACSLDATPVVCAQGVPLTTPALSDGPHTLLLVVTDKAGNSAQATRHWTVGPDPVVVPTTPPATPIGTTPSVVTPVDTAPVGTLPGAATPDAPPAGGSPPAAAGGPAAPSTQVTNAATIKLPPATAEVTAKFKSGGGKFAVTTLKVSGLDPAATVALTCTGRKCPAASLSSKPKAGTVDLKKLLKGKSFNAGNAVTVKVTQPLRTTRIVTIAFPKGKKATVSPVGCLPAGATAAVAC